ncbi:MAG: PadR family transcriptional regulator [Acidobacteria bacterium]|nr:PadR family transcriptional regulator [Acidobacteriota bacterium]
MSDRAAELIPLSPPVFHVLLALGESAMHGYAMMQSLEDKTHGAEALLPGTLYATIARMVDAGLIEESTPPADATDKRRRYYGVTSFGREVATLESERLARLLSIARAENLVAAGSGEPS